MGAGEHTLTADNRSISYIVRLLSTLPLHHWSSCFKWRLSSMTVLLAFHFLRLFGITYLYTMHETHADDRICREASQTSWQYFVTYLRSLDFVHNLRKSKANPVFNIHSTFYMYRYSCKLKRAKSDTYFVKWILVLGLILHERYIDMSHLSKNGTFQHDIIRDV